MPVNSTMPINLLVALNSEARPLIEHFDMKPDPLLSRLRVFSVDNMRLVICGIGPAAAATAVGYLSASDPTENPVWVNIGVAGHPDAAIGRCFLVDKLIEEVTQRTQYPSVSFRSALPSATLRTVVSPQTDYPHDALYDMEGSSFFEAATKFTSVELVSLVKLVSDNRDHPLEKITKQFLYGLVKENIDAIAEVIGKISALAAERDTIDDSFAQKWLYQRRATATQCLQFKNLCQRLRCLAPEIDADALLQDCADTRSAIALLEQTLSTTRLKLS